MSSQDKMTQSTNFSPHRWFELQEQQPRPSNKRNFEIQQLKYSVIWTPTQARNQEKLQRPIRHVENVELTTKGLQERKHNLWDDGGKIGKIILTKFRLPVIMRWILLSMLLIRRSMHLCKKRILITVEKLASNSLIQIPKFLKKWLKYL